MWTPPLRTPRSWCLSTWLWWPAPRWSSGTWSVKKTSPKYFEAFFFYKHSRFLSIGKIWWLNCWPPSLLNTLDYLGQCVECSYNWSTVLCWSTVWCLISVTCWSRHKCQNPTWWDLPPSGSRKGPRLHLFHSPWQQNWLWCFGWEPEKWQVYNTREPRIAIKVFFLGLLAESSFCKIKYIAQNPRHVKLFV